MNEHDGPLLFRLHADDDVARVMPRAVHVSIAESEALLQRILAQQASSATLGWVISFQGEAIGTVGLVRIDHEARRSAIAYELVRERWRRGLGREAVAAVIELGFSELGLTHIDALVDSLNDRSARFAESLAFVLERSYPETIDGSPRTTLVYVRSS